MMKAQRMSNDNGAIMMVGIPVAVVVVGVAYFALEAFFGHDAMADVFRIALLVVPYLALAAAIAFFVAGIVLGQRDQAFRGVMFVVTGGLAVTAIAFYAMGYLQEWKGEIQVRIDVQNNQTEVVPSQE